MNAEKLSLPQGTLDLLVLRLLKGGPMHGWGIVRRLNLVSRDVLQLRQGTVYPALYRMEAKGWIKAEWDSSDSNRRAKYYRLTTVGKKRLQNERVEWAKLSQTVALILDEA